MGKCRHCGAELEYAAPTSTGVGVQARCPKCATVRIVVDKAEEDLIRSRRKTSCVRFCGETFGVGEDEAKRRHEQQCVYAAYRNLEPQKGQEEETMAKDNGRMKPGGPIVCRKCGVDFTGSSPTRANCFMRRQSHERKCSGKPATGRTVATAPTITPEIRTDNGLPAEVAATPTQIRAAAAKLREKAERLEQLALLLETEIAKL